MRLNRENLGGDVIIENRVGFALSSTRLAADYREMAQKKIHRIIDKATAQIVDDDSTPLGVFLGMLRGVAGHQIICANDPSL